MEEKREDISEEQVKEALGMLGVFVGDLDGKMYVKCNNLQRALVGYRDFGDTDHIVSLKQFTERLNNEQEPE